KDFVLLYGVQELPALLGIETLVDRMVALANTFYGLKERYYLILQVPVAIHVDGDVMVVPGLDITGWNFLPVAVYQGLALMVVFHMDCFSVAHPSDGDPPELGAVFALHPDGIFVQVG